MVRISDLSKPHLALIAAFGAFSFRVHVLSMDVTTIMEDARLPRLRRSLSTIKGEHAAFNTSCMSHSEYYYSPQPVYVRPGSYGCTRRLETPRHLYRKRIRPSSGTLGTRSPKNQTIDCRTRDNESPGFTCLLP